MNPGFSDFFLLVFFIFGKEYFILELFSVDVSH